MNKHIGHNIILKKHKEDETLTELYCEDCKETLVCFINGVNVDRIEAYWDIFCVVQNNNLNIPHEKLAEYSNEFMYSDGICQDINDEILEGLMTLV